MLAVRAAASVCAVGAGAVGTSLLVAPPTGETTYAAPVAGALDMLGVTYLVAAAGIAATVIVRHCCLRWALCAAAPVWGAYGVALFVGAGRASSSFAQAATLVLVAALHVYLAYEAARHCR